MRLHPARAKLLRSLAVTSLIVGSLSASAQAADPVVPGEVIVRFDDASTATARVHAWGAGIALRVGLPGVVTVKFASDVDTVALAREIAGRPGVRWAEPNRKLQLQALPNDPRIGEQWGLSNSGQLVRGIAGIPGVDSNAAGAWDFATGGDALVAVADSGVALTHPDLASNVWTNPGETGTDAQGRDKRTNGLDDDGNSRIDDWRGWDFVGNDNDPSDAQGHGTTVAGLIGAVGNNGVGISGVAQRVKLMPLRIGGSGGRTDSSINADAAAAAMLYASAKGAKIFSGAFGGSNPSQAQEDAIAATPGVLYVFPAGNAGADNDVNPSFPCNFNRANILCVGAITSQGAYASYSNYSPKTVDLAAPGHALLTTSPFRLAFDEPFEQAIAGRWTKAYTALPWDIAPDADGTHVLKINGAIPQSGMSAIVSSRFSLAGCQAPLLSYDLAQQFKNGAFNVWITEDANAADTSKWVLVDQAIGDLPLNGRFLDLASYAGKSIAVALGTVTGVGTPVGAGPTVDDLKISCVPNVYSGSEYDYVDGTSVAAPQVAGAAALVLSQYQAADANYLRSAILNSATPMPSLTSKTVTGGRLNVLGALDTNGPAPFGLGEPGVGATTADRQPTFSWSGTTDDKTGVARYDLVIDGVVAASTDAAGRSARPLIVMADGAHSWKVDAIDGAGQRTSSETRTITLPVPAAPPLGPSLKVGKLGKVTKASIAKSGFSVPCTIGVIGRCRVAVRLSKADAKKLGLKVGKKSTTFLVGKGSAKVGKSGKVTVKVKPSKATAKVIKRGKKKVTFVIEVVGVDAAGHETVTTVNVKA